MDSPGDGVTNKEEVGGGTNKEEVDGVTNKEEGGEANKEDGGDSKVVAGEDKVRWSLNNRLNKLYFIMHTEVIFSSLSVIA